MTYITTVYIVFGQILHTVLSVTKDGSMEISKNKQITASKS